MSHKHLSRQRMKTQDTNPGKQCAQGYEAGHDDGYLACRGMHDVRRRILPKRFKPLAKRGSLFRRKPLCGRFNSRIERFP